MQVTAQPLPEQLLPRTHFLQAFIALQGQALLKHWPMGH